MGRHSLAQQINVDLTPIKLAVQTISAAGSRAEPRVAQSRVFGLNPSHTRCFCPFYCLLHFGCPWGGVYTQLAQMMPVFKQQSTFKPSEFQALNIQLDYGHSPEPQRLSRREKIALKLTQITKTIIKD